MKIHLCGVCHHPADAHASVRWCYFRPTPMGRVVLALVWTFGGGQRAHLCSIHASKLFDIARDAAQATPDRHFICVEVRQVKGTTA